MVEFIFMLTQHDRTVGNGVELIESLADTGLRYVGFKDVGASAKEQQELTAAAHRHGMEVMLEVVSTSAEAETASLHSARAAGVDWVLGGTHPEAGISVLGDTGIKYCPFPGVVTGHPSILSGSIESIAEHAKSLTEHDSVAGVDLLTYRHQTVDAEQLTTAVAAAIDGPLIVAGGIVTEDQIALVARSGAWGFTIGTAIFEAWRAGGPPVADQVVKVLAIAGVV
ncbi:hypothetical protein [Kribbella ginsengisoli]|uniref:4-hydroxythreonine-4-phosphate dehydrogenase n=1 Tax=Kribbella ginsengisoli TaxID=363865 RepID=A0ABP6Z6N7_9ACTN